MKKKQIRLPTDREISLIFSRIKSSRNKLIVILALRLGLRASEIAKLCISGIDWHNKTVSFIGKGDKPATLPLTDEVLSYLEDALKARPTNLKHDFLIWNTRSKTKGISRFDIYYLVSRYGAQINIKLWPHLLRHKFGSDIAKKGDIYRAKEALRHERIATTADIYAHLDIETQRHDLELLDSRPLLIRFLSKFKPPIPNFLIQKSIPAFAGDTIGRKGEFTKLNVNNQNKIHTALCGPRGSGTSHLLRQIKGETIFFLDDITPPREKLVELAEQIKAKGMLSEIPKGRGTSAFQRSLIEEIKGRDYTLVIDSISDITKQGIIFLRKLKEHFTIITSIETKHRNKLQDIFYGSHDVIEINNLNNEEAYKLADIASIDLPTTTEGRELFLRRVVAESKGNPKAIMEIIEKERKRGKVINASTEISHEAIQEPLSATPFLSSFLIIAIIARYGASSLGMPDWKIILVIVIIIILVLVLIDKKLLKDSK